MELNPWSCYSSDPHIPEYRLLLLVPNLPQHNPSLTFPLLNLFRLSAGSSSHLSSPLLADLIAGGPEPPRPPWHYLCGHQHLSKHHHLSKHRSGPCYSSNLKAFSDFCTLRKSELPNTMGLEKGLERPRDPTGQAGGLTGAILGARVRVSPCIQTLLSPATNSCWPCKPPLRNSLSSGSQSTMWAHLLGRYYQSQVP